MGKAGGGGWRAERCGGESPPAAGGGGGRRGAGLGQGGWGGGGWGEGRRKKNGEEKQCSLATHERPLAAPVFFLYSVYIHWFMFISNTYVESIGLPTYSNNYLDDFETILHFTILYNFLACYMHIGRIML